MNDWLIPFCFRNDGYKCIFHVTGVSLEQIWNQLSWMAIGNLEFGINCCVFANVMLTPAMYIIECTTEMPCRFLAGGDGWGVDCVPLVGTSVCHCCCSGHSPLPSRGHLWQSVQDVGQSFRAFPVIVSSAVCSWETHTSGRVLNAAMPSECRTRRVPDVGTDLRRKEIQMRTLIRNQMESRMNRTPRERNRWVGNQYLSGKSRNRNRREC